MYQRSCTVCFSVNAEFFSAISPQVRKRGGGVRSSLFCTISARVVAEFEASLCQDVSPLPFLFSKHCLAPFHTVCLAETFICNTHYTHAQHHCHHYTPNPPQLPGVRTFCWSCPVLLTLTKQQPNALCRSITGLTQCSQGCQTVPVDKAQSQSL